MEAEPDSSPPNPVAALTRRRAAGPESLAAITQVEPTAEERLKLYLGDLKLCCRLEAIAEVTAVPSLFPLPHQPRWLAGVTILHGDLLPVADLSAYAGLSPPTGQRWLVVTGEREHKIGLLVDDLPDTIAFAPEDRFEAGVVGLPASLQRHCVASYRKDSTVWMEIKIDVLAQQLAGSSITTGEFP